MKIIENIITSIIVLALGAAICIGAAKFTVTYANATMFGGLGAIEKSFMMVTDSNRYHDLLNDYNFISSIPLLGETL